MSIITAYLLSWRIMPHQYIANQTGPTGQCFVGRYRDHKPLDWWSEACLGEAHALNFGPILTCLENFASHMLKFSSPKVGSSSWNERSERIFGIQNFWRIIKVYEEVCSYLKFVYDFHKSISLVLVWFTCCCWSFDYCHGWQQTLFFYSEKCFERTIYIVKLWTLGDFKHVLNVFLPSFKSIGEEAVQIIAKMGLENKLCHQKLFDWKQKKNVEKVLKISGMH